MKPYTGIADCGVRHVKELGVSSLWRGNVANCIRYVPTAACNLAFKDFFKSLFPKRNKETEFAAFAATQVLSGSLAGAVTNTIVYPLIYVRTVLGADLGAVKKYRGTQFGLQDTIKAFNPYQKDFTAIGLASKFVVAQIAVSTSGIVAYPFDTVQRRMQIEASKPKDQQIYSSVKECITKIFAAEGPGGFFKGALANIARGTGAAIVLGMYDEIQNFIKG